MAWCLFCDVVCLNYDGNILDAALISFIAALQNLRLPEVKYDSETERVEIGLERVLPVTLLVRITLFEIFSIYTVKSVNKLLL